MHSTTWLTEIWIGVTVTSVASRLEFHEIELLGAVYVSDMKSLDCTDTLPYSPRFVFLKTRHIKMFVTTTYGGVSATRKAEEGSIPNQTKNQTRVTTAVPMVILG